MKKLIILSWILGFFCCRASASEFPYETTSCFTGDYQSQETFYKSRGIANGSDNKDSHQTKHLKTIYQKWRDVEREKVTCRFFTYHVNGLPVTGFFIKPRGIEQSALLPVIFNRGGNADNAIRTPYLYDKLALLAERGFLVVGSFYRGANINGIASPHRLTDEFGGEDVNDVIQLLSIIDHFDGMRKKKVGMWGVSRGGMMAYLAAKKSRRFSAIVADSTPVDLLAEADSSDRMDMVFETWIPHYAERREAALIGRSVKYWYKDLNDIPILILHGTDDKRVSPNTILDFAKELQSSNYPYELIMYDSVGHGLRGLEDEVNSRVESWLKKHANQTEIIPEELKK